MAIRDPLFRASSCERRSNGVRLATALALLPAAACSVLFDSRQCKDTSECRDKGGAFAGTTCNALGFCESPDMWVAAQDLAAPRDEDVAPDDLDVAPDDGGGPPDDLVRLPAPDGGACGSKSGGPQGNPIADRYGGAYPWVDEFRWSCVYNIKDYSAKNDDQRYQLARDAAAKAGGGVVYFPAGVYTFTADLILKPGVILRGDPPPTANAQKDGFSPPSRLQFPKYVPTFKGNGTPNGDAFKKIRPANASTNGFLGLVHLDIDRAGLVIAAQPDKGMNDNIVVFGVRSNDVATPSGGVPQPYQDPWSRFGDRNAANIDVFVHENALIANNRLNDAPTDDFDQPGYKAKGPKSATVSFDDGSRAPFRYTDHHGIVVNRKYKTFVNAADPKTEPSLFRKGIVIRDNWIYKTMGAGILASGEGLVIHSNVLRDALGKAAWVDASGRNTTYSNTNLGNRCIDWSGANVTIGDNDCLVYRHQIGDTSSQSADGEGIYIQECCGGTKVKGVAIRNNVLNSNVSIYRVPAVNEVTIEANTLSGNYAPFLVYVSANTDVSNNPMSNVLIRSNHLKGGIAAHAAAKGSSGNLVDANVGDGSGAISYSCGVALGQNTGFTVGACQK